MRDYLAFVLICPVIGQKLGRSTQPIRNKTKTDRDLVIRVFPRFLLLSWFYFEFSLANKEVNHRFDWTCDFVSFGFSTLDLRLRYFHFITNKVDIGQMVNSFL